VVLVTIYRKKKLSGVLPVGKAEKSRSIVSGPTRKKITTVKRPGDTPPLKGNEGEKWLVPSGKATIDITAVRDMGAGEEPRGGGVLLTRDVQEETADSARGFPDL